MNETTMLKRLDQYQCLKDFLGIEWFKKMINKYLFSWEKVPGNDSERLIEVLMQNFNVEWIKAAKINKNDDGRTIRITNDTNFLSLTLNNEKNKVNIEIDDGRTDKFIVKTENGELNIYNNSRPRKHPLHWLLKQDIPYTAAVLHNLTDNLKIILQVIEKDPKREEKEKRLCGKLKNTTEFYNVLPEIEWAVHLKNAGFPVSIEPSFPEEGPDLKVKIDGRNIYFEIKSLNRSEEINCDEITDRIKKIQSRFFVSIVLRDDFSKEDIFPVIELIRNKINKFERENICQPVSFYYFSSSDIREWYGYDGLNPPHDVYSNSMNYPLFWEGHKAKAKVTFLPLKDYSGNTIVGIGGPVKFGDDAKRIGKSLRRTLRQLPTSAPAVVIIDVTFSYADCICVEDAIYGNSIYITLVNTQTGEIADEYWNRERYGIFQSSTRISAVVMYKRKVSNDGFIEFERKIYRNPKAKNPLDKDQISKIGEVMNY